MSKKRSKKKQHVKKMNYNKLVLDSVIWIVLFLVPSIVFSYFTSFLFPAKEPLLLLIGFLGCLIIGIGLIFLFIFFKDKSKKRKEGIFNISAIPLVGLVFVIVSCVLSYGSFSVDDGKLGSRLLSMFFVCLLVWSYFDFRSAVKMFLRSKKVSNTNIKKSLKGKKNYWLLQELHEKFNLGSLYMMNKVFLLFCLVTIASSLLAWLTDFLYFAFCCTYMVASITSLSCLIFTIIQNNNKLYGKAFVLIRKKEHGPGWFHTVVGDFLSIIFPVQISFVNFWLYNENFLE